MARPHNGEVAPVQGGDLDYAKPFGDGNDAGVDATETEVRVNLDQLGDAFPVDAGQRFNSGSPAAMDR